MLSLQDFESGFERFLERLLADERVAREFELSRAEFFADPTAARVPGSERRHLEWFLLERPSSVLGAVPVQAWKDSVDDATTELGQSFFQSLAGAFEVTSLVPGEGLWARDLFTLGEHPVVEARASLAIEVGDLLVGRLFPAGGGAFLLSPAASVFRNPALLTAVRADLAEMRLARRGVLRVQQLELEHLFHGPGSVPAESVSSAEALARAEAALRELGLPSEQTERALKGVRRALRSGESRVLTEVMNRLAFETGVDLAAVRLVLAELWDVVARAQVSAGNEGAATVAAAREAREIADAAAALEAFDRGRAQGKDLELLFRELERQLGVDGEESDEEEREELVEDDTAGAPDFPGVVGAMVEEFLWELGYEQGEERAQAFARLRELGNYAKEIGVFDELGPARLVDFSARWLLDESGLTRPADVESLLEALAAFCRWSEERHGVPLWKAFEATLEGLRNSVPRHLRLRQHATAGAGDGAYRVLRVDGSRALVRATDGREREVNLSADQSAHLCAGDLVRIAERAGAAVLGASYPPELAELLVSK